MTELTVREVLAVKYLQGYEWSSNGRWIAYLWNDGGVVDAWITDISNSEPPQQVTNAKENVSGLAWQPQTNHLALVVDGNLCLTEISAEKVEIHPKTFTKGVGGDLKWSPNGKTLSFSHQGEAWYWNVEGQLGKIPIPGKVMGRTLQWSPCSQHLLFTATDESGVCFIGVCSLHEVLVWIPAQEGGLAYKGRWVNETSFIFQDSKDLSRKNDFYLVSLYQKETVNYRALGVPGKVNCQIKHIVREELPGNKGGLRFSAAYPNPLGTLILLMLENDGWLHHYLYDIEKETLTQVTNGSCEDFGTAGDEPCWSPDGTQFAFASNKNNLIQRHIWVYDVHQRQATKVVEFPDTNLFPKWSPDGKYLAFVHADYARNADLWVMDAQGALRQLTDSMPQNMADKMQRPQHVTYKGALNWDIDGFILKPLNFNPQNKYPAIVWVHGGPIRQMRGGWHPSRSYGHFYGYNQYLASKGYVVMEINFRGGIGYGTGFRFGLYHKMGVDDVTDVVNAGRYLKDLPYVDEEKVAVYGLSYGGYMTLHALTQYPDEFCLGINIAGIWDFAQWTRWIEKIHGRKGSSFAIYFGGSPEESPQLYQQGSPVTFKNGLAKPLINFHGTKDVNVDFEQMDRIVKDCVTLNKTYEAYYYPDEVHFFNHHRTWIDALAKLERAFETYLK